MHGRHVCCISQGYDYTPRSSASDGCRCAPTTKQMDDYQVDEHFVEIFDGRVLILCLDEPTILFLDCTACSSVPAYVVYLPEKCNMRSRRNTTPSGQTDRGGAAAGTRIEANNKRTMFSCPFLFRLCFASVRLSPSGKLERHGSCGSTAKRTLLVHTCHAPHRVIWTRTLQTKDNSLRNPPPPPRLRV